MKRNRRTNRPSSRGQVALQRLGVDPGAPWLANLLAFFLQPGPSPEDSAASRVQRLFPHVDFCRLGLRDIVRIPLQALALLLVRFEVFPTPRRARTRQRPSITASLLRRLLRRPMHRFQTLTRRLARSNVRLIGRVRRRMSRRGDWLVEHPLWRSPRARLLIICVAAVAAFIPVTTPLEPASQALFATTLFVFALFAGRVPGKGITLLLISISILASTRYLWWRLAYTMNWDDPWALTWGAVLLAAEFYAWLVLLLGYFQCAWPLQRKPVALRGDPASWPTVDVFIPTYNEPLAVVAPAVIAALAIDWPRENLRIYLLDDGRREEMRRFAAEMGAQYITRPDNRHAKAGNLNHALGLSGSEYVAIFDCDHVPTRNFLTSVMGWFQRDDRLALVQTPHHFFSPDPFERNLDVFRRMPNEGELFHSLIQDGNDLWNATFFCGSCAVIRRGPLEEVGGFAVETVTEDAHTALRLQRHGYGTALINVPLAAGLATESLSAHIGQRIRWARGMAQIFRLDNPFLGPGLRFAQRVCYGSAILHFFNGGPRLIFLTAPLAFLAGHLYIINASAVEVLLYALPHLIHASITNSRVHARHRRTFWSDLYETVLAWYILVPTTLALVNPRSGKFNVTAKGGVIESARFDWVMSRPFLALAGLNVLGLALGIWRLGTSPADEIGTTLLNIGWTVFNLVMLGAAIAVAAERVQRRNRHRAEITVPIAVQSGDGRSYVGQTVDVSLSGAALAFQTTPDTRTGDRINVSFPQDEQGTAFAARVVAVTPNQVRIAWTPMSRAAETTLVQCSLATSGVWSSWGAGRRRDRPMRSLLEVVYQGGHGYRKLAHHTLDLLVNPVQPALDTLDTAWRDFRTVLPRAPAMPPFAFAGAASGPRPEVRP